MRNLFLQLIPFILLGVLLVVFAIGLLLFSYILILGALIGLVLFIIQWLREKFFKSRSLTRYESRHPKRGRTFEHEDDKK